MQDIQTVPEPNQGPSSLLPIKVQKLGAIIYHVNQLSPFATSDETLIEWSNSINELLPELDHEDLKSLINAFKTDTVSYNTKLGIQNIFIGLKKLYPGKYFPKPMTY